MPYEAFGPKVVEPVSLPDHLEDIAVVFPLSGRNAFCWRKLTVSSDHCVVFAFSLVQYRTWRVPLDRPGKKSAICFHVKLLFSFRSIKSWSSSGVNLSFGPLGRGAGGGIPICPTTLGAPPALLSPSRRIILFGGPVSGSLWW